MKIRNEKDVEILREGGNRLATILEKVSERCVLNTAISHHLWGTAHRHFQLRYVYL